jgi:hypothetical protein
MGEQITDVRDEGEVARDIETVGECRGNREADEGVGGVSEGNPAAG